MSSLRERWQRLVASEGYQQFVALPPQHGYYRVTPRRLANLYLGRLEYLLGRKRLRSSPVKLTVESTSICNLRCPACFTGAGEVGRARGHMSPELYDRLLDELGPYLFEIEFHNWGEPLLAKQLAPMVERAARRGIATTVSTNFSIPFDAERAEALVRSGLSLLGVSIDGARQETYEQYRVRGNLELVLQNCRLVRDAKRRLKSATPRLIWEFHVFEHNAGDVPLARQMAEELEMQISVDKGWVVGEEWDRGGDFAYFFNPRPYRCPFLWRHAVVNNDGGVAPCCGTFYEEDDREARRRTERLERRRRTHVPSRLERRQVRARAPLLRLAHRQRRGPEGRLLRLSHHGVVRRVEAPPSSGGHACELRGALLDERLLQLLLGTPSAPPCAAGGGSVGEHVGHRPAAGDGWATRSDPRAPCAPPPRRWPPPPQAPPDRRAWSRASGSRP